MFETKKVSKSEIVLKVSGSMTGDSVYLFERALKSLQNSSYQTITLDLSQVADVSSLFVGHILHCHQNMVSENKAIRICGYQEAVGEILKLLKVADTIPMNRDPI